MKHKASTFALLGCAAHLFCAGAGLAATQSDIPGPAGSGQFGWTVTTLPNGNIVVTDPRYDAPGPVTDVGAVYLYTSRGELISTLTGSSANDLIGSDGVVVLANGNYVVPSPRWFNAGQPTAGAITWCSGTSGCNGTVSSANSLVGSSAGDSIGKVVVPLANGNYVTTSDEWNDGANQDVGAVAWCNGTSGCTGVVSSANSLVGSTAVDRVGNVRALANGHYVATASNWDNGAAVDAGAAVWCDGTKGCFGPVTTANSLHGTKTNDHIGSGGVLALTNGNYVVRSRFWSNGTTTITAGAATWCSGTSGCVAPVSPENSLVGKTAGDLTGSDVTALTNGHYVVVTESWDNGAIRNVGAVTWCDGATGCTGEVSAAGSLIGSGADDLVGSSTVIPLANGNYVVNSPNWNNGGTSDVGAATWCNGTSGCIGVVSPSNSLIGETPGDKVGYATKALTTGHYVVQSSEWNNGATRRVGAATFCNGTTGRTGIVSASNSLIGSTTNDRVGAEVAALANGNYVVGSQDWDNGAETNAGAATWCSGAEGCVGIVSAANSLVGSAKDDQVNYDGIVALANGDYLVRSSRWGASDFGAVTWGSGTIGRTGVVSPTNSLIGGTANDSLWIAEPLPDGNYFVLATEWDNGLATNVGAVTLGRGNLGTVGSINATNSVRGSVVGGGSFLEVDYDPHLAQLVVGRSAENIVSLFTYRASSFTVTTTADHDDGACSADDCTLREALLAANANADDNSIGFAPGVGGTIELGGALPSLSSNIDLQGPGADVLTVRRNSGGDYRIFTVTNGADVAISGLTISNGQAPDQAFPGNSGGGILNDRSTLAVWDCKITGNRTFGNNAAGGGILNHEGTVRIEESTVTGNVAHDGGGIANVRRTAGAAVLVLRSSTIDGNTASGGSGGGVYNEAKENGSNGTATLINCTLSGNSATPTGFFGGLGGAIYNAGASGGAAQLLVQDCTLSDNSAPSAGGIYNNNFGASAFVRLQNTILKNGATGGNFINSSGSIVSLGHNLANDDAGSGTNGTAPGGFLNATGDIRNTDARLGPLQDNDGPTLTHALLSDSPAINAGQDIANLMLDQRGFLRVGANDIGAFESGGTVPPPPSPTPNPSPTPQPTATPNPTPAVNRLANISTRLRVESGDNVLIGGFIVTGSSQKRIIIRALGPSLPVAGALPNPVLELFDGNGQFIASNDNWREAPNVQEIIDSTIAPPNELESAIVRDVELGAYTAVVRDAADGAGVGLVEVYDLGATQDAQLANISTRGHVLTGDDVMIGGFIVTGATPQKVIVRAIGPSLGIPGQLGNPAVDLFDGNGNVVASNNDWKDAQQAEIEATTIPPANDLESAIVATLPPASYTAAVSGINGETGVALIEVYALN